MKLSNSVEDDGLIEEITRITSATPAVYTNRARVANLNNALDQYWFYAAESAPAGTFDDTGKTSAPIETQNLVNGTNQYKMTDFTNKILQIVKMSILDADGIERDLIYEDFDDIIDFIERYDTAQTSTPTRWTKLGDYIFISDTPGYNETSGLRAYVNRELSKFIWVGFSVVAGTDVFTSLDSTGSATDHGFSVGDSVIFETDTTIPAGITADTVVYYVISVPTTSTFKVSTTIGGTTIDVTDTGTGNHKYTKVSKEPGIPIIHHDYLARYASYEFLDSQHPKFAKLREQLAIDKFDIQDYWQSVIRPGKTIIETNRRVFK